MRLLDQADDLELLGGRVSHAPSSPAPVMLFLSRRFSSVRSATASFRALASRRSALTSSDVAARAVSPASRFFPASRNSLDQLVGWTALPHRRHPRGALDEDSTMTLHLLGIDIAKNVFQLHGVDAAGRVVLRRRVMRDGLLQVIAQLKPCTIALEACTGA